jgi:CelD/BcsL family acetyltransferase involved in cellulose biosynthesis
MVHVQELNEIDQLSSFRQRWGGLLVQTAGATFFQSPDWLEVFWKHYGAQQKLRLLVVMDDDHPTGILPLVVRRETTSVGRVRLLTYPLHDWGSFYGPIGPDPAGTLAAGLDHIRRSPRDWDVLELRWQGASGTNLAETRAVMQAAGLQAYATVWDRTAIVELTGTWESYWSTRKAAWLQRFRSAEQKLLKQGELSLLRYRPRGLAHNDGSPRWDLYDTCEEIARRSWQGAATDGTTLSHESVRAFLRDVHQAAAAMGAVDLNLLLIDGAPAAFLYNYYYGGYVSGLRRGYDAERSRQGAGNVLMAYSLRDSFTRGDRIYDLGVGSLNSKRHFQTRVAPILRFSHYPLLPVRLQLLRARRWWQQRRCPVFIAVGRVQDGTANAR